jgi:hypothetical protein
MLQQLDGALARQRRMSLGTQTKHPHVAVRVRVKK